MCLRCLNTGVAAYSPERSSEMEIRLEGEFALSQQHRRDVLTLWCLAV